MADWYRQTIEDALRQYNSSFPDDVYEALAWEGLIGTGDVDPNTGLTVNPTDAWQNKSNAERLSIINTVTNFRNSHPKCSG